MNMIEVKTAALSGAALDWVLAKVVGHASVGPSNNPVLFNWNIGRIPRYSTEWAVGGPLIDEYAVEFEWVTDATIRAFSIIESGVGFGPGHLIAACRAIVAAKLGDTVQIPAELLP